jgi:L-fuculose-phosphate aldolase
MRLEAERIAVVETARQMAARQLVVNTSGNVSVRAGAWLAITPSAMPYELMRAEDVCLVDIATGAPEPGSLMPSSELPLHLAVYRDTGAGAVVHTHSHFATVLSTLADSLPAIHYDIVDLGPDVPVAPYATFGSAELAAATSRYLRDRNAVLMRNHGVTTVAHDLPRALARAFTVEWIASVYWHARVLGEPSLLDAAELGRVAAAHDAFRALRARHAAKRG